MKFIRVSLALFLFLTTCTAILGQDSLNVKFREMIESTETFNQYKVIPRTRIDAFWSEVLDSLKEDSQTIDELMLQVETQEDSIQSLSSSKKAIQASLDESLMLNDSISFVGLTLTKSVYHLIVWGIILILALAAALVYFMYLKSNRVTSRSKKELETLQLTFEEHKNQSREKQVKLKRELQTAINTMEEMKRGRSQS